MHCGKPPALSSKRSTCTTTRHSLLYVYFGTNNHSYSECFTYVFFFFFLVFFFFFFFFPSSSILPFGFQENEIFAFLNRATRS
mgnify:CR=1 FL=1